MNWDPRYTLAQGVGANPDHKENYRVHISGPRLSATNITGFPADDYFVNPTDNTDGFIVSGTLPTNEAQSVHSLTESQSSPWDLAKSFLEEFMATSISSSTW